MLVLFFTGLVMGFWLMEIYFRWRIRKIWQFAYLNEEYRLNLELLKKMIINFWVWPLDKFVKE